MNEEELTTAEPKRYYEQLEFHVPSVGSTSEPSAIKSNDIFSNESIQWSSSNGKIFLPTSKTLPELIPAYYEAGIAEGIGLYFEKLNVKTEGLLEFPDAVTGKITKEIETFWDREPIFREYGITFKRGLLLFSAPGHGKTCTLQLVARNVIRRGGIVLKFTNPSIFILAYRKFREIQPDTPMVVLMEDSDSTLNMYSETERLNILDGAEKLDKVVFLATTNYPEELGDRIINRPSRFDRKYKCELPNEESRKMYINFLIGDHNTNIDVDKWAKDTNDFSLAHIKELFTAVVILGDEYEEILETLRKMKIRVSSEKDHYDVGFRKR